MAAAVHKPLNAQSVAVEIMVTVNKQLSHSFLTTIVAITTCARTQELAAKPAIKEDLTLARLPQSVPQAVYLILPHLTVAMKDNALTKAQFLAGLTLPAAFQIQNRV